MIKFNKNRIKKLAFLLSIVLFFVWALLGTGASLAWFNDSSSELKNVFHVADFDLEVFYRTDDGRWKTVEEDTELFGKDVLYEPGFTQIAYLKVRNNGNVPFDWKTAVTVYDYVPGINVFGAGFDLQDYLKFGIAFFDSEQEMDDTLSSRRVTDLIATEELSDYSTTTSALSAGDEIFVAVVVRMPTDVTSVANYKVPYQPEVYLGVIVSASQQQ